MGHLKTDEANNDQQLVALISPNLILSQKLLHSAFRSCIKTYFLRKTGCTFDCATHIWSTPSYWHRQVQCLLIWPKARNSEKAKKKSQLPASWRLVGLGVCHVATRGPACRCRPGPFELTMPKEKRNKLFALTVLIPTHCLSKLSIPGWNQAELVFFHHHHFHCNSPSPPFSIAGHTSTRSDEPGICAQHYIWQPLKTSWIPFWIEYSGALKLTTRPGWAFLPASFSPPCLKFTRLWNGPVRKIVSGKSGKVGQLFILEVESREFQINSENGCLFTLFRSEYLS